MFLICLIFLAALSIESVGAYISVLGLAAAFASDPIILAMAVILDFCKVIAVSTLSKRWNDLNTAIKGYLLASTIVLMTITSSGVAGYLSNSFQKAILPNQGNTIALDNIKQEQVRLAARKKEIDAQIAQLPTNNVKGRQKLIATFKSETDHINQRLNEIDVEIPKLQTTEVKQNSEVGPVMFLSKALGVSPESAVSIVIGLIVFVFDPLAIVFLVTGNRLLNRHKRKDDARDDEKSDVVVIDQPDAVIGLAPPSDDLDTKDCVDVRHIDDEIEEANRLATEERLEQAIFEPPVEPEPEIRVIPQELTNARYIAPTEGQKLIASFKPTHLSKISNVPVPVEVIKEVIKEVPVEQPDEDDTTRLDRVLKDIFAHHDGNLSDSERERLNQALDRIFPAPKQEKKPKAVVSDDTPVVIEEDISFVQTPVLEEPEQMIESEDFLRDMVAAEVSQEVPITDEPEMIIPSSLEDPALDTIRGANAYFVGGDSFADPSVVNHYKS